MGVKNSKCNDLAGEIVTCAHDKKIFSHELNRVKNSHSVTLIFLIFFLIGLLARLFWLKFAQKLNILKNDVAFLCKFRCFTYCNFCCNFFCNFSTKNVAILYLFVKKTFCKLIVEDVQHCKRCAHKKAYKSKPEMCQ